MIATVYPGKLSGALPAIPSKSHVHRLLICAALAGEETRILCPALNADIEATVRCLNAMCARITYADEYFTVHPAKMPSGQTADCGESGSTYRFLLPVAAALGTNTVFRLHGRLPARPMGELTGAMERHGVAFSGLGTDEVSVTGRITGGRYELPGDVSSQYISALIFAIPLTGEPGEIVLTTPVESKGYINMTLDAVRSFGITAVWEGNRIVIPGGQKYVSPGLAAAEGDWSNAAFILCAAAAGGTQVDVSGLNPESAQGDRAVSSIIESFGVYPRGRVVSIADIPDLAPALAVLAAAAEGETRLTNAARLRLKESDRIAAICDTLSALGADARGTDDEIIIRGGKMLKGGTVDSVNDHRIAMMAACCAVISENPVTITCAEAVRKSYPRFFDDIQRLGLKVELR